MSEGCKKVLPVTCLKLKQKTQHILELTLINKFFT
jgi:hypothetical protein